MVDKTLNTKTPGKFSNRIPLKSFEQRGNQKPYIEGNFSISVSLKK
jgi:hypothetical protein